MDVHRRPTCELLLALAVTVMLPSGRALSQEQGTPKRRGDPKPEFAVVLEPCLDWRASSAWTMGKGTENFAHDFTGESPRFSVGDPDKCMVWTRPLRLPVSPERYPILVLKYRARNTGSAGWHYVIWLDDGTGPRDGGLYVVRLDDLVADGEVHEIRKNLWEDEGPKGPVKFIAFAVYCGKTPPATFELLDLRFVGPPGATPAFSVPDDTPVRVMVRDREKRPIKGATVTMDAERRNFSRRAMTAEDGVAQLVPLKSFSGKHTLHIEKEGMYTLRMGGPHFRKRRSYTVSLVPAARYGGFVRDEAGAPIEGAAIGLFWKWYRSADMARLRKVARTDAQGRWRSPPLPVDIPQLSVRTWHPDYLCSKRWAEADADAMKALRAETHVILLGHGTTVSGRVVDDRGRPVTNAKVKAMVVKWHNTYGTEVSAETDATGAYRLERVPRGSYHLVALGDSHAPSVKAIRVAGKPLSADLTLNSGVRIKGKVVDAQGKPLGGVAVRVGKWENHLEKRRFDSYLTTLWETVTGDDGLFEWNAAPKGPVMFNFRRTGYRSYQKWFWPKDNDVVVTLYKPLTIRGTVTDAETGKPVPSFLVIQGWLLKSGRVRWLRRSHLDARGRDGEYSAKIGLSGDIAVRVQADGYLPATSPTFKKAEGERRFDVALRKSTK